MKAGSELATMMPLLSMTLISATSSSAASCVHSSLVTLDAVGMAAAACFVNSSRFASDASTMSFSTSAMLCFNNSDVSEYERFDWTMAVKPTVTMNATTMAMSMRVCKMRTTLRSPAGVIRGL